jgi:hypothetical protein
MKGFWEKHDATARKGRITQAAAIIFAAQSHSLISCNVDCDINQAVKRAIQLEAEVSRKVDNNG